MSMWKKGSMDSSDSSSMHPLGETTTSNRPQPVSAAPGQASRIGPSVKIVGELHAAEAMTFDGEIDGQITLDDQTLVIGPNGYVKGEVSARMVRVEGTVEGNITASEKIVVTSSGSVCGDIVAPRLSLDDGAKLKGSIDTQSGNPEPAPMKSEMKAEKSSYSSSDKLNSLSSYSSSDEDDLKSPHVIHS